MRFPLSRMRLALAHTGSVLFVFGFVLIVPLLYSFAVSSAALQDVRPGTFGIPMLLSLLLGAGCRWLVKHEKVPGRLGTPEAMLVCLFGWVVISAIGAIPFSYQLGISYLDSYFEAISGFTTTGITMLSGLDGMPRSLLFWRSMTQWIGGLGILTFFLAVVYQGGISHRLFGAESHKVAGERIASGMWNTLKILWAIYVLYTALVAAALLLCGMPLYDAISHSFTALSTGGYSPHDASIAWYEQAGHRHYRAIDYVLIVGMWLGGTNFLIHYHVLTGSLSDLWRSDEMKGWWLIIGGASLLVLASRIVRVEDAGLEESFRHTLFQVTSIATTTGFGTRDIGGDYFSPLARQIFLALMLVGGCAGSTGGGIKVFRAVLLYKVVVQQVRKAIRPISGVELVLLDRRKVDRSEVYRTAGLFFAWILLLFAGSLVTAAFSDYGAIESASGMFSALGNIGPAYIPVEGMAALHPLVKVVYILGMLAGRLELIPLLILFTRRSWQ